MSGLFPAGSEEGEEEITAGGKQKGRDASTGAVYAGGGGGSSKGPSSRLHQAV